MINSNSLAAAVGVGVKNVQFQSVATVLKRRIGIVATFDPLLTGVVADVPVLVTSAADVGDKFGFGFMAHRLAIKAFKGGAGVETYVIPQDEAGGAAASAADIDFVGSSSIVAGTVFLYIAGDLVAVSIPSEISGSATTADDVADLVVAAIALDANLPVTAVVNGVTTSQVDFTAKSQALWGDDIDLSFNLGFGQELPGGIVAAITPMAAGSGTPDIQTALETGLGIGDVANALGITDLVHGYGLDTATLDAISTYVGAGNDFTGLYDKLVARPFRALTGDTTAGSGGLSALIAISDVRLLDRANGVIAVPGSQSHPSEIAAQAIGVLARVNNGLAEQTTIDESLDGIWSGDASDQWTATYANRDTAVGKGIGTTLFKNSVMTIQNLVTFYRPANVPVSSNGYRSMRNISILQNILAAVKLNFEQEKWKGISIVSDTNKVGGNSKAKARDTGSVIDDLVALARSFESNAWIFTSAFTIDGLREVDAVKVRVGGDGFVSLLKVILSGEGGILDTVVEFDTSIAALLS